MGMSAGALALGGGLAGLFGAGSANNVQLPQMFQMPQMAQAAGGALSGIGGLSQFNTSNIPQFSQISQGLVNNPYAAEYQQGANAASPMGQQAALNAYGAGGNLMGLGGSTLPAWAGSIFNTSMDPQQALYNRTLQQVQDQTRAADSARGIATTPFGAGNEAQAIRDFNMEWTRDQLSRQIAGAQAGGGLLQAGAGLVGQGANLQAAAPGQYTGASAIPYGTFGQIGQGQLGALSGLQGYGQQAATIPQQQIQDYFSYLGAGNQAGNVANQTAGLGLQQNQQAYNQYGQAGQALGAGLYGLSRQSNPFGGYFGTPLPTYEGNIISPANPYGTRYQ